MRVPSRWSMTQPAPSRHAPKLGEHTFEVMSELGYDDREIEEFLANAVIGAPTD